MEAIEQQSSRAENQHSRAAGLHLRVEHVIGMSSEVLEAKEVAQLLKVSVRTVVRLAERGEMIAFKVGDLWRFHRADVDAYIEEQKRKRQKKTDE